MMDLFHGAISLFDPINSSFPKYTWYQEEWDWGQTLEEITLDISFGISIYLMVYVPIVEHIWQMFISQIHQCTGKYGADEWWV